MTILRDSGYTENKLGKLSESKGNEQFLKDEAEMIRKAQTDNKFFEPLYNRYYDSIFRFIFRKTDDEQVTADLTSHVFLKAMNALGKYEIRDVGFGAWLYKIATNETYKYFRDNKKRFLSLESDKVNQVMNCDQLEDGEDKLRVLRTLIDELDEIEIRILELKFFENKNFAEISYIVEKKESTVKMRLYRSLNKLKEKYQNLAKPLER